MLGESRKCNETAPFPGTECIPTTDGNFLVWTLEDFTWCGGQKIINSEGVTLNFLEILYRRHIKNMFNFYLALFFTIFVIYDLKNSLNFRTSIYHF